LPALLLLTEIIHERQHQINQPARNQRISEIDEQIVRDKEIQRKPDQSGDQTPAEHNNDAGGKHRRRDNDGEPK
jgi:hypothetical protein